MIQDSLIVEAFKKSDEQIFGERPAMDQEDISRFVQYRKGYLDAYTECHSKLLEAVIIIDNLDAAHELAADQRNCLSMDVDDLKTQIKELQARLFLLQEGVAEIQLFKDLSWATEKILLLSHVGSNAHQDALRIRSKFRMGAK